jgi:hypothetical protein
LLKPGACYPRAHRRGAPARPLPWRLRNGARTARSAQQFFANKIQKAPKTIPVFNSPFV